jgi:predicted tellurium resistance membrane protein TerC
MHTVKESPKTPKAAVLQILFADISMSLDNVLAVAGAGREHPMVLVFGLVFSIFLMAVASSWIAKTIGKYRIIGYLGLLVIVWVALEMIWSGWGEVAHHFSLSTPFLP